MWLFWRMKWVETIFARNLNLLKSSFKQFVTIIHSSYFFLIIWNEVVRSDSNIQHFLSYFILSFIITFPYTNILLLQLAIRNLRVSLEPTLFCFRLKSNENAINGLIRSCKIQINNLVLNLTTHSSEFSQITYTNCKYCSHLVTHLFCKIRSLLIKFYRFKKIFTESFLSETEKLWQT